MMAVPKTLFSRLGTIPREERRRDSHGNRLRYWATVAATAGPLVHEFDMVDVFFKQVE